ncbi:hypothetical protein DSO57_1009399 [Entomophthora muscae]|uniref:Uncharacterized protein n=1 Tax=Entomophthora muscae TaxID=34485 RepID=A0ACC2T7N9_9FUNG|nr:hypothetical protein DSO57_1009399 [Entomophthora muscae]
MEAAAGPCTVLVFVLDTSTSMNQNFEDRLTYLCAAKAFIRGLIKNPDFQRDRNLQAVLFTYGKEPFAFQSRLSSDPHFMNFLETLSKVKAYDTFNGDKALQAAYEYLHLFRMENNLDTLGGGRTPWCNKPNFICWLTDGEAIVRKEGIANKFDSLPAEIPGLQYFQNDYRWDQRLYIYHFTHKGRRGIAPYLEEYARPRGGHIFPMQSFFDIKARLETQVSFKSPRYSPDISFLDLGLFINLVDMNRPSDRGYSLKLLTNTTSRLRMPFFPFPENYWAKADIARLPVRETAPIVAFERGEKPVVIPPNYPYDKYKLQPCPLTEEFLACDKPQFWLVNAPNSFSEPGKGFPFGVLTANTSRQGVNLLVMGYNFPLIWQIIQKSQAISHRPDPSVANEIKTFLSHTPFYYHKSFYDVLLSVGLTGLDLKDVIYTNTEAMYDIQQVAAHAHDCFCARGYHHFLSAPASERTKFSKDFSSNVVRDVLSIPRCSLLSSLHKQKHYFFECGRVDDISQIREALPANRRSFPIEVMSDHRIGEGSRQRLRNALDSEEDVKHQERIAFGNLYLKREDNLPRSEGQYVEDQAVSNAPARIGHHQAERRPRRRSISPVTFNYARIPCLRPIPALSDTEDDYFIPSQPHQQTRRRPPAPRIPPSQASTPTSSPEPSSLPGTPIALRDSTPVPMPPAPVQRNAPTPPLETPPPPTAPREQAAPNPAAITNWAGLKARLKNLIVCKDEVYNEDIAIQQITECNVSTAYPTAKKYLLFKSLVYHAKVARRRTLMEFLDLLVNQHKP